MLAPNKSIPYDSEFIKYPQLASPKLDGHRLLVFNGSMLTRSLKQQPNNHLQERFKDVIKLSKKLGLVFDAELYDNDLEFYQLSSVVRSFDKELTPKLYINIFDTMSIKEWEGGDEKPFSQRVNEYRRLFKENKAKNIYLVPQKIVKSAQEAEAIYNKYVAEGYEGIILRDPDGRYKHGRATLKEGLIFKMKEWESFDGIVLDFSQAKRMIKGFADSDERTRDVLGHRERSYKKEHYELVEDLGCIYVQMKDNTIVGTSLAADANIDLTWDNRKSFLGKHVEVRYQKSGTKDKPRIGFITRLRPDLDD